MPGTIASINTSAAYEAEHLEERWRGWGLQADHSGIRLHLLSRLSLPFGGGVVVHAIHQTRLRP